MVLFPKISGQAKEKVMEQVTRKFKRHDAKQDTDILYTATYHANGKLSRLHNDTTGDDIPLDTRTARKLVASHPCFVSIDS